MLCIIKPGELTKEFSGMSRLQKLQEICIVGIYSSTLIWLLNLEELRGLARSVGLNIKDFLPVPIRSYKQVWHKELLVFLAIQLLPLVMLPLKSAGLHTRVLLPLQWMTRR
ncbi:hypothetical protein Hdeb2414_s0001g00016451 [Helianthus debilis subsp. tardiflorus]